MRAVVLMYHSVGEQAGIDLDVPERDFRRQMDYLADSKFDVLDLAEFVRRLKSRQPLSDNVAVLTFDDGYQGSREIICSTLKRYSLPATFFLIADKMGQYADWLSTKVRLMDWKEAREIVEEGFSVGSHAMTHRRLNELVPAQAREEIFRSKEILEDNLGVAVQFFAYPYGCWNEPLRKDVIDAGYSAACTTRSGFNNAEEDLFALRRLDINGQYSLAMFKRSLAYGENFMPLSREVRYYSRRALSKLGLR